MKFRFVWIFCFLAINKRLILTITTSLILLLSSIYGNTNTANVSEPIISLREKAPLVENVAHVDQPITLETYVRTFFKENPILAEVARCESQFRQYGTNGKILRGVVNQSDVGIMQINEYYHLKEAQILGLDIHTVEGNILYAKRLYEKEGTQPWQASSACWKKPSHIALR